MIWFIARAAHRRPSLQHALLTWTSSHTVCGLDTSWWSKAYTSDIITEVVCMKCLKASQR